MKKACKIFGLIVAVIILSCSFGCDKKELSKPMVCDALYESNAVIFENKDNSKKECVTSFSAGFFTFEKLVDIKIENLKSKGEHLVQLETDKFIENGYTEVEGGYIYHVLVKAFVTPSNTRQNGDVEIESVDFLLIDKNGETKIKDVNKRKISVFYVLENNILAYSNVEDGLQNNTRFFIKSEKTIKINSLKYADTFISIDEQDNLVDYTNLNLIINANSEELIQIKHKMLIDDYVSATYLIVLNYNDLGSNETFDYPVCRTRQNKELYITDYFKTLI